MSKSDGWIKFHRKFIDSNIGDQPEVGWVWIHLLLRANWEDRQLVNGEILKRGQLIISQRKFSKEIGLTRQQVRTAFLTLSTIRNLTHESTHQGTLISIVNYDKYQSLEDESNPPINPPLTHSQPKNKNLKKEEGKNVRNLKKILDKESKVLFSSWLDYKDEKGESFKPLGLKAAVTRFLTLVEKHGIKTIENEIQRAMAGNWKGFESNLPEDSSPKPSQHWGHDADLPDLTEKYAEIRRQRGGEQNDRGF